MKTDFICAQMAFQSKSASCLSMCWKHFYFTALSGPQRYTYCSPTPRKKNQSIFFFKKEQKKKTQNKTKPKKEENCIFCRPKYCFLTVKSNISKWENIFCFHAISARLRSPPLSTDVNRCGEQKGTRKRKEKSQSCHKRLVLVPSLLLEAAVREV